MLYSWTYVSNFFCTYSIRSVFSEVSYVCDTALFMKRESQHGDFSEEFLHPLKHGVIEELHNQIPSHSKSGILIALNVNFCLKRKIFGKTDSSDSEQH